MGQEEERAKSLDAEISRITKSTRTTVPALLSVHDLLRQKYSWYYKWHLNPLSKVVHTLILTLWVILATGTIVYSNVYHAPTVKAAADYSCTFDGSTSANWNDATNWDDDAACNGEYPGQAAHTYDVTIPAGKSVTLNANNLDLTNGGTAGGSITIAGTGVMNTNANNITALNVNDAGTLTTTSTETITVKGNWDSSAGTFTYGTSTVKMTGSSKNLTTSSALYSWDMALYNLIIDTGATISLLPSGSSNGTGVNHDLTISGSISIPTGKALQVDTGSTLTINEGGVLTGDGSATFAKTTKDSTPAFTNNGTISVPNFNYNVFATATAASILATTYGGNVNILGYSNGVNSVLSSGTMSVTGTLIIRSANGGVSSTFDNTTNNSAITVGTLSVGYTGQPTWYSTFKPGTGILTVSGNATIYSTDASGDNKVDCTGVACDIRVAGNWTNSDTFTAGNSTVTFNGTTTQTITGTNTWYNLTINNTYATPSDTYDVDPAAAQTVTNTFTITHGQYSPLTGDSYKDVSIANDAHAILKPDASAATSVSGNWAVGASGVFTANSGTVTFTGVGKTISGTSITFNKITIDAGASVTDQSGVTISGTPLTINGTFTIGDGKTTTFSNTGATLAIGASGVLNGEDIADSIFKFSTSNNTPAINVTAGGQLGTSLNVNFYSTVSSGSYSYSLPTGDHQYLGNVKVDAYIAVGGSPATATITPGSPESTMTINGDLNLSLTVGSGTGTVLNMSNSNSTAINIGGSFTRTTSGGSSSTVKYTKGSDTLTFNGSGAQSFDPGTSSTFNNVTYSGSGTLGLTNTAWSSAANITLFGTGNFTPGRNISITGNWTVNTNAVFTPGAYTVTFTGNSSAINGTAATQTFYGLTLNKTSGQSLTAPAALYITGALTLTAGNFSAGANTYLTGNLVAGGFFVGNTGTITFNGNTTLSGNPGASHYFNNVVVTGTLTNSFTPNSMIVKGNWDASAGTYNHGGKTMWFSDTAGGHTIDPGASHFYNLSFTTTKGTTGHWSPVNNPVIIEAFLTMTSCYFDNTTGTPSDVFVYGTVTGTAGTINLTASTLTQRIAAAKNFGSTSGSIDWTFNNLKFENSSAGDLAVTAVSGGTGKIIVNDTLTVGSASDTNKTTFDNETNDRIIDAASVSITTKGVLSASSTASFTVSGNWTNAGTFTANSGTVNFDKSSDVQTLNSGGVAAANIFNHLTHSGAGTLQLLTNDINIDGNFTNSGGTFDTNGEDMVVAGNVDLTTGSFTQGTGTITLDGTGAQSFTAGGTGAGHTPYNLTVTNASAAGVTFADSLTLASGGTLADNTANSKLTFTAGATYTIPNLDLDGTVGNLITLVSSTPGTHYHTNVTNAPTLTYVNAKDSDASGGALITANTSNDSGGNTNWSFGGGITYISGTVYTAENKSTNLGAGKTIGLSVNGGVENIATTTTGGAFSFNSVGVAANNTLTFFVDGDAIKANLVTQVLNTTDDITGLELFSGDVVLRHETTGPMTNTLLATADNLADEDMFFSVDGSNNATFSKKLWLESANNYTPGGNVTVNADTEIRSLATLNMGASDYILTLGGTSETPLILGGTLTTGTSTVKYTTVNGSGNVNVITLPYSSLQFTPASTETYDLTASLTDANALTGSLTIDTNATLNTTDANYNINLAGNWTNNGVFTANSGTVTFSSANEATISGSTTFNNLIMDAGLAKTINFSAGIGNKTIINGTWNINNSAVAEDDRLTLKSSTPTSAWEFVIPADMNSGDYITVSDSQNNTNAFQITPGSNVTDLGNNNPGWLFAPPVAPTIQAPTALSATTIRWNFLDTTSNELGYKVYDASDVLLATCVGADLTYCDETSLSVNTQYTGRYVVSYNNSGNSPHSATANAIYTLANTPLAPSVTINSWDETNGNSLAVITNVNDNPSYTQFAISCNSTPDSWLQEDGSCGGTKVWKNKTAWETGTTNYLKSLPPDTDYTLITRAKNGDSVETSSEPTNGPNKTAPAQVQSLGHATNSTGSITWSWDANVVTPDGYNVYDYTGGACTATLKETAAGTSVLEDSLSANTQYTRCARAYRGVVTGQPATNFAAYTSIETPTGITFGTIAADSIAISASGTISNLSAGNAGLYFTQTSGGSGGGGTGFETWTSTNNLSDTDLAANTQYGYKVKARNGDSEDTTETVVSNKYTLANIPLALSLNQSSSTSLRVIINPNSNPTSTPFALYNETLGKYIQADGTNGDTVVWQDYATWGGAVGIVNTGLVASTTYTYQGKARNGDSVETSFSETASQATSSSGSGTKTSPSPTATVTISPTATPSPSESSTSILVSPTAQKDTQAPTAPTNLRATKLGAITLTLNWDSSSDDIGVKGYDIYNAQTGIKVGTTTNNFFDFSGLTPSSVYKFYVRAFDSVPYYSPNSEVAELTTLSGQTEEEKNIEKQGGVAAFLIVGNLPKEARVGQPLTSSVKVTVADVGGSVVKGYAKAIYFTSSDNLAKLAYNESHPYTFTTADTGVHEFAPADFVFNTAGRQQLTANDNSLKSTAEVTVSSTATTVLQQSATYIEGFFNNPQQVSQANVVVASSIAGALLMPILVNGFSSLNNLWPLILYFFVFLSRTLGLRRHRKPWGVVFNSQTGQPVPFALVKLLDKNNHSVELSVSDSQGRYGFSPKHGIYTLKVARADFIFPSKSKTSSFYERTYTDSEIKISDVKQNIAFNIPIDPYSKSTAVLTLLVWLIKINHFIQKIRLPLFALGAIFSLTMIILNFSLIYALFLAFCILMIIFDLIRLGRVVAAGAVSDAYARFVSGAIVRIYHKQDNRLVDTDISSKNGQFKFKVRPGVYYLVGTKPGYIDSKTHLMYLEKGQKEGTVSSIDIKLKKE